MISHLRMSFSTAAALLVVTVAHAQPEITAAELRQHVEFLASPELDGRKLGTPGTAKAEDYIAEAMRNSGLKPLGDAGGYFQEFEAKGSKGRNVIGMIEGCDPVLKEQVLIIGAHHDHIGTKRPPGDAGECVLHPGADDNASGVAGLLELVESFASTKTELKRSIVFIAFAGEEAGLLGSRHYVAHPVLPLASTVAMLNLDMIGRLVGRTLIVPGTTDSPELAALARRCDPDAAFAMEFVNVLHGVPLFTDHLSFTRGKIPALTLNTGIHPDMHQPTDTADKLNYEGMTQVLNYARRIARLLDHTNDLPAFTPVAKPDGKTP